MHPNLTLNEAFVQGEWVEDLFATDLSQEPLQQVIQSRLVFSQNEDSLIWDLTPSGIFQYPLRIRIFDEDNQNKHT